MQIEIPERLYALVESLAKRHRRDVSQEIQAILEKGIVADESDVMAQAKRWRQRLQGRRLGNTVTEIREDRER